MTLEGQNAGAPSVEVAAPPPEVKIPVSEVSITNVKPADSLKKLMLGKERAAEAATVSQPETGANQTFLDKIKAKAGNILKRDSQKGEQTTPQETPEPTSQEFQDLLKIASLAPGAFQLYKHRRRTYIDQPIPDSLRGNIKLKPLEQPVGSTGIRHEVAPDMYSFQFDMTGSSEQGADQEYRCAGNIYKTGNMSGINEPSPYEAEKMAIFGRSRKTGEYELLGLRAELKRDFDMTWRTAEPTSLDSYIQGKGFDNLVPMILDTTQY